MCRGSVTGFGPYSYYLALAGPQGDRAGPQGALDNQGYDLPSEALYGLHHGGRVAVLTWASPNWPPSCGWRSRSCIVWSRRSPTPSTLPTISRRAATRSARGQCGWGWSRSGRCAFASARCRTCASWRPKTTETATLSLLAGDHRVYAEQVESAHPVRQSVAIGSTAALHLGASGKAMLAFLPAQRRESILRQAKRTAPLHADGSPMLMCQELSSELEAIRQRGFATSRSERVLGAASAAAPVYDHHGDVVASVSVAGVTVAMANRSWRRSGRRPRRAPNGCPPTWVGQLSPCGFLTAPRSPTARGQHYGQAGISRS